MHAKVDIGKGEIIKDQLVKAVRPGNGISADKIDEVIGKKARNNIKKNKVIKWRNLY